MINEKLIKLIPFGVAIILLAGYALFFNSRKSELDFQLANMENQRTRLQKKVKALTKSNREKLENGTDIFFSDEKFFEEYIREIFNHNKAKISQYRIQIEDEEKDRGAISVLFDIPILHFFVLLWELEEGKKLIIIKSISVRKRNAPYVQVQLKLEGYYK